ncbi:MAG: glycosyltransferase family 39 protein [Acidobacteriota bacterium]
MTANAPSPGGAALSSLPTPSKRLQMVLLGALLLVALALRLDGITFGLPHTYHFDENNYVFTAANFEPREFHFMLSPLFGTMQVAILVQNEIYAVAEPMIQALPLPDHIQNVLADPTLRLHLIGRLTSAACGALVLIPVFLIGRRLWGPNAGLAAAAFMTFCYVHARSSHYGVPDALCTLMAALCIYFSLRLSDSGSWRHYLLAGAFAGFALSAKLLSWPIVVTLFLFHAVGTSERVTKQLQGDQSDGQQSDSEAAPASGRWGLRLRRIFLSPRLTLAAFTSAGLYLLLSPHWILHTEKVLTYWKLSSTLGEQGGVGPFQLDPGGALLTYFKTLLWGFGTPLALFAVAGLALALVRPASRRALVLMSMPVLFYAFISKPGHMYFPRYSIVGMPYLLLAGAALLIVLASRLPVAPRGRALAAAAACALLVTPPTLSILEHNRLLDQDDTRTLAKQWVEENLPEEAFILMEEKTFGPALSGGRLEAADSSKHFRQVVSLSVYGAAFRIGRDGQPAGFATPQWYRQMGVDYLITNSWVAGQRLIDPQAQEASDAFYASLESDAELVYSISPLRPGAEQPTRNFSQAYGPATELEALERPGTEIRIYRLPDVQSAEATPPAAPTAPEGAEAPASSDSAAQPATNSKPSQSPSVPSSSS